MKRDYPVMEIDLDSLELGRVHLFIDRAVFTGRNGSMTLDYDPAKNQKYPELLCKEAA